MKKVILSAVLIVICFSSIGMGAAPLNPYWIRISEGLPNQLVVLENTWEREDETTSISVQIPQLWGLSDADFQSRINQGITGEVKEFVNGTIQLAAEAKAMYDEEPFWPEFIPYVADVTYEVKYNQGGMLSVILTFYQFTGGAHGMTHVEALNFDLTTGREITFYDLFPTGEEREMMIEAINEQINENPEWFFISEVGASDFGPNHAFYFQDGEIVVYFGLYEIAPYAAGIQEFSIPVLVQ